MAEIINLKRARKARARADAQAQAAANRTKFGRTRAEKARDAHEADARERRLDGNRREE